jgi:hypothetical protein
MSSNLRQPWEVVDGSVQTASTTPKKLDFTGRLKDVHDSIAFNVGNDVAKHIVELHNSWLLNQPPR